MERLFGKHPVPSHIKYNPNCAIFNDWRFLIFCPPPEHVQMIFMTTQQTKYLRWLLKWVKCNDEIRAWI